MDWGLVLLLWRMVLVGRHGMGSVGHWNRGATACGRMQAFDAGRVMCGAGWTVVLNTSWSGS